MRTKLSILLLFFTISTNTTLVNGEASCLSAISNGWYNATVKYYNPNTYTQSTYSLSVKVENDAVTAIDFGNGGSVHSGYNNSGYTFSGGWLTFQKDFNGNITSATTSVTITKGSSSIIYSIKID